MKEWKPQNMRIINREDGNEKGVCYEGTKQTWVTLHRHISIPDLIDTCVEESTHEALRRIGATKNTDVEQEEWFVEQMFWALRGWILDV